MIFGLIIVLPVSASRTYIADPFFLCMLIIGVEEEDRLVHFDSLRYASLQN